MVTVPKILAAMALAATAAPAIGQLPAQNPAESVLPSPPYADYADLVVAAPVIADATIRSVSRLTPAEAPDLPPGTARLYVEADIAALIRAGGALPPRIGYLLDVPLDAKGQVPRLRKARVLLFARTAPAAGQLQLVRPDGQRTWTPGGEALARRITRETLADGAPPAVTGIGNAFHVAGALPGEGETQIFLTTAGGRPVSLGVIRAADGSRTWSVALSEIVDAAAGPPQRDTLLWYRLACGLPPALPEASLTSADPADAATARDDYRFVLQALGRCERSAAR